MGDVYLQDLSEMIRSIVNIEYHDIVNGNCQMIARYIFMKSPSGR